MRAQGTLTNLNKWGGISNSEARLRQIQYGPNSIVTQGQTSWLRAAYAVIKQPIFLLLICAGLLYLLLGDIDDAIILMGFIGISTGITIFQQYRSERALQSLHRLINPHALVIRDGIATSIAARDLVPGDIFLIKEGDRIHADARIVEAHNLMVDESLLTGESIPIDKTEKQIAYSGTLVIRGDGMAEVLSIGSKTQLGKIGASLVQIKPAESQLQLEIRTLIRRFAVLGFSIAIISFLLYGILQDRWFEGALVGISITMALLPEEFSVVLTVFLALGIWKISRIHVLTRYAPVIETLGSITILCVDKTGTLTKNSMKLASVATLTDAANVDLNADQKKSIALDLQEVITVAMMASDRTPFDPMEKAIHSAYQQYCPQRLLNSDAQLKYTYGLSPNRPVITHIWDTDTSHSHYRVTAKGAPETIMHLCQLSIDQRTKIDEQISGYAMRGLRILGVAQCQYEKGYQSWPNTITDFHFQFVGLIGLSDPLRKTVPAAIQRCREAGIRVAMITGDHLITAQQIANQAGIDSANTLTGAQIESMDDATLQNQVKNTTVFVRIPPTQKLRIVQAMQANSEIVAMTGDGINDAPALKAANVGISMGKRGTDVAREASSLVLLNDDFSSLFKAIRQGRRIFDNLQKAINYIIAVHIPIAGAVLLPQMFGNTPILTPIHILFLEIIIDPACAIIYEMEREEAGLMKRPPRDPNYRWFRVHSLSMAVLQGIGILVLLTASYIYGVASKGVELANTTAFALLAGSNLILIIVNRSKTKSFFEIIRTPNPSQKWILLWAISAFLALISIPHLRDKWVFTAINPETGILLATLIVLSLMWCEFVKKITKSPNRITPQHATS